jgi:ribonuclease Z
MAEIYFLGTGGWVPTPQRDNTSVLLRAGGKLVLIDCAGSAIAKIRKLDFDPREVSTIIITHVHPDHIYGLPSFIHSLILEDGEIRLLGSEETVAFARRLLDLFGLRGKKVRTRVRFLALRPGHILRLDDALSIRSLRVPHHSSSLAYHFYLNEERKEIIFSGDTPVHKPLFDDARAADCLIHEASAPSRYFKKYPRLYGIHTSALDLGRWSRDAGVKRLIPCHFLADVWSVPEEVRAEIRRTFEGRLIIPRDLQCLSV